MPSLGRKFWTPTHETLLIQSSTYSESRALYVVTSYRFSFIKEQWVYQIPWPRRIHRLTGYRWFSHLFLKSAFANTEFKLLWHQNNKQKWMDKHSYDSYYFAEASYPRIASRSKSVCFFPFLSCCYNLNSNANILQGGKREQNYSVWIKSGSSLCWLRNREFRVWATIRNWSEGTEFSCSGKAQVHLENSRHIHFQLWWTDFSYRSTQIKSLPDIPMYCTPRSGI